MHGSHALERKQVVHVREHAFFHLAAVPRVEDNLYFFRQVENYCGFRVESKFLVVFYFCLGSVHDHEIGFAVVLEFLFGRTDEHVLNEMSLPCHFADEADFQTGIFVGSAESVYNIEVLVGEFFYSQVFYHLPCILGNGFVVVFVKVRSPPDSVFGGIVHNEEFIFRRTAGVNACHYVYGAEFGFLSFFKTLKSRVCFVFEKLFVRRVVVDVLHTRNAVL